MCNDPGQHLMLAIDHVADAELGKLHMRLGRAVGGRSGNSIAQRVHQDDVILRAVHYFSGANQVATSCAVVPVNHVGNRMALDLSALSCPKVR